MKYILPLFLFLISYPVFAQNVVPLYSGTVPNSIAYPMKEVTMKQHDEFFGYQKVSAPSLEIYMPEKKIASGAAVIICPGGGYSMLTYRLEGIQIAETFIRHGIAAFILKYRLPSDSIMKDKSIGPLQDAQQAIKQVRQNAEKWNLDPNKIGIMGFSAGGHLASTAGTHFDESYIPNKENISLRPDFMILVYPVISMQDEITHLGSRTNLLGEAPSGEQINLFSNELQINKNTPPTWITHTSDDTVVPVENSIRFYQGLIRNKIPAEMHLYPYGNHGFVLHLPTEEWMESVFEWMEVMKIVN